MNLMIKHFGDIRMSRRWEAVYETDVVDDNKPSFFGSIKHLAKNLTIQFLRGFNINFVTTEFKKEATGVISFKLRVTKMTNGTLTIFDVLDMANFMQTIYDKLKNSILSPPNTKVILCNEMFQVMDKRGSGIKEY